MTLSFGSIVAVHGLNGGALRTWTTTESGICWLNDPQFLPKYIENGRVLVSTRHVRRPRLTSDKVQGLSYAQTRTGYKVSHDYSIFSCTYGILFFGTPHHGASKAGLDYLEKLGAGATLGTMSKKSDLVSALESESETLQNITDYFVPIMRNFNIFFFWEQDRTNLLNLGLLGSDYIVAQQSAAPTYDETERAAIAADHCGMVRFETDAVLAGVPHGRGRADPVLRRGPGCMLCNSAASMPPGLWGWSEVERPPKR